MPAKKQHLPLKPYATQGGRTTATVGAAALHRSVARSIAAALRAGLPERQNTMVSLQESALRRLPAPLPLETPNLLGSRAADLRAQAKRVLSGLRRAEEETVRAQIVVQAEQLERQAAALDRRAKTLAARPEPVKATFHTDLAFALDALGGLARGERVVSRATRAALDQLLVDWRMSVQPHTVRFSFLLRVLDDRGRVRLLGPVEGQVQNNARVPALEPQWQLAEALPQSLVDRMEVQDPTQAQLVRPALRRLLEEAGLAQSCAAVLSRSEVAETLAAVWCHLTGEALPTHADPLFASHAVGAYVVGNLRWTHRSGAITSRSRERGILALAENGGRMRFTEWRRAMEDYTRPHALLRWSADFAVTDGAPLWPRSVERTAGWRQHPNPNDNTNSVELVQCGHCGKSATVVLRVPECPDALLCGHCRRMPRVEDSPVFPERYLQLTAGIAPLTGAPLPDRPDPEIPRTYAKAYRERSSRRAAPRGRD